MYEKTGVNKKMILGTSIGVGIRGRVEMLKPCLRQDQTMVYKGRFQLHSRFPTPLTPCFSLQAVDMV